MKKTLIATTLALVSTTALAIPSTMTTGEFRNFIVTQDGTLHAAGACGSFSPCGPTLTSGAVANYTATGVTDAATVSAGRRGTAYINKNGDIYKTGSTSLSARGLPWEKVNVPGKVVDSTFVGLDLFMIVVTDQGKQLYKMDRYKTVSLASDKTDWVQIHGALQNGVALDSKGDIYSWGVNQLLYGSGATERTYTVPTTPSVSGLNIKKVTIGNYTVTALDSNNLVWTWGDNGYNKRLGHCCIANSATPIRMLGMETTPVKDAVSWFGGSYLILNNDDLATTGWDNLMWQPKTIMYGTNIKLFNNGAGETFKARHVTAGMGQTIYAVLNDGTILGGSSNRNGSMGIGDTSIPEYHKFQTVEGMVGVLPAEPTESRSIAGAPACDDDDGNNGHGNNIGGIDCSNPGLAHRNEKAQGAAARAKSRQADLIAQQLAANLARKAGKK